jgi:hypothetical protein
MEKLLELGPDLAYVLAALANAGQISASQIKKARIGLPILLVRKMDRTCAPIPACH